MWILEVAHERHAQYEGGTMQALAERTREAFTTSGRGSLTFSKSSHKEVTVPIEQVSPELERIVSLDQEVEELGSGYRVGEGPLWWQEGGYLLFSEVRGNRRRKWAPGEGVTVLQEPTNNLKVARKWR